VKALFHWNEHHLNKTKKPANPTKLSKSFFLPYFVLALVLGGISQHKYSTPPARITMDSNVKALIVKKFKDAEMDLDVGRHWIEETVVVRIKGSVERHEEQLIAPTVSIPLIPTIAFFWDRLGVEKDAAMRVLREAITEAMQLQANESPAIKSRIDDVAEAVAAVKRDLISELPKMRRTGKTDVSDLRVTITELTPVSEPLYAVA
jgi:hypothetical protein